MGCDGAHMNTSFLHKTTNNKITKIWIMHDWQCCYCFHSSDINGSSSPLWLGSLQTIQAFGRWSGFCDVIACIMHGPWWDRHGTMVGLWWTLPFFKKPKSGWWWDHGGPWWAVMGPIWILSFFTKQRNNKVDYKLNHAWLPSFLVPSQLQHQQPLHSYSLVFRGSRPEVVGVGLVTLPCASCMGHDEVVMGPWWGCDRHFLLLKKAKLGLWWGCDGPWWAVMGRYEYFLFFTKQHESCMTDIIFVAPTAPTLMASPHSYGLDLFRSSGSLVRGVGLVT